MKMLDEGFVLVSPPNRDKDRPWDDDLRRGRRAYHRLFAPLPPLPEHTTLLRRTEIADGIPASLDEEQIESLLDEAEQLYDGRKQWSERSEARAISLMSAVGLASGLVIAGAGLLLDATKVADPWWRRSLGALLLGLLVCLILSGLIAARAVAKGKIWARPQWEGIRDRSALSATDAKRARAIELLALSSQNYWVAAFRSRQVVVAGAWYRRALAFLGLLAITLAVYVAIDPAPPKAVRAESAESGPALEPVPLGTVPVDKHWRVSLALGQVREPVTGTATFLTKRAMPTPSGREARASVATKPFDRQAGGVIHVAFGLSDRLRRELRRRGSMQLLVRVAIRDAQGDLSVHQLPAMTITRPTL